MNKIAPHLSADAVSRMQGEAHDGAVIVAESGRGAFGQVLMNGRHLLAADEPRDMGGDDRGPGPYDFLLMGLGSCTSMTVRLYAARKDWPLERVVVRLRHDRIHAQDCADCETKEGMVDRIQREVEFHGPLDAAQKARLLEIANKCPVHRTLSNEIKIETRLKPAT